MHRCNPNHPFLQPCQPECKQVFPSAQTVVDIADGKPGAWFRAASDMIGRAGIIGLGLYVAGDRENLVKKSIFASAAIETTVILIAMAKRREKQA